MEFRVSHEVEASKAVVEGAATFGITPESFITSFPGAGMQALTIIREGLVIVGRDSRGSRYVSGQELFKRSRTESDSFTQDGSTVYPLTEEAEEFSRDKGVPVRDLVMAGGRLLVFAAKKKEEHKDTLFVASGRGHKLDSMLNFRVTPLNTIAITRKKASPRKKATYRVAML